MKNENSKGKALSKVSNQDHKDMGSKPSAKEWRGGKEKKGLGEGVKCANCGSLKHEADDCTYNE